MNNEPTYQEMCLERLLDIFHKAERKGLIPEDNKFVDVSSDLELYRNLTQQGLYFTVVMGDVTVNYEKGNVSMEFASFQSQESFSWSDFLEDFNKEVNQYEK